MSIRLTAFAAVTFLAAGARPAACQQPAPDTLATSAGPSADAARAGVSLARPGRSARVKSWLPGVFYGTLAGAATAAAVLHVDPDTGGYHDGWTTATDFPDKAVHALAAWAITNVGVDLGARPRYAALAVCAAGTAFEFAQGYVSPYDIASDCAGAAGAAAWQSWRARRRARAAAREAARNGARPAAAPDSATSTASPLRRQPLAR